MSTDHSSTSEVKRGPSWLLLALAPLIPAFFTAIRNYLQTRFGDGHVDSREIVVGFVNWAFLGALAPFVYVLANRYPIRRSRIIRTILVHTFGVFTVCVVWGGFGIFLGSLLHRFPWQGSFLKSLVPWMSILMSYSVLLYVLTLWALLYYREARERESQQGRLATQLAEARLSALRMQLNPHFLFNSLNAITVLVRDQRSEEASEMLELLSDVLREVLQTKKHAETTLREELAFVEKYLTIEQVRFSDRLQVQWSIAATVQDALVPEFVLQPLVENAIRHGINHTTDGGVINIAAAEKDGVLVLSVCDNGRGVRSTALEGLGLNNTRERLATLYGDDGQLTLTPVDGGGTSATLRFPIRRSDA